MENPTYIKAGRLNKTFGLKGHLRAYLDPAVITRLKKLPVIYLYSKNSYLPYFPDETDLNESGHCMFHFEEVKDKTAADQLVGKEIYVDESTLKKTKPYSSLADFIGFNLIDETAGLLAPLDNIIELPNHDVGQFIYLGNEVLFPWNEQVILKIDKRKKEIRIRLPEGLMDIYMTKP
ncbi:MAG: hypothetical protein IPO83_16880 [Chitinophagaceae bacterium]|nr:hypothetical protein [Chitinophagaceae bacterium]